MKYAFLIYPHQNVRYRASLLMLAKHELSLTLRGLGHVCEVNEEAMGGAAFLTFEAPEFDARERRMLSQLASVYMMFTREGGLLAPMDSLHPEYVSEDLPALLKYKGKTNEMFTDAMLTMALAVSGFMDRHDTPLTVCDPMAGRGTTLMLALRRGYHAAGIEIGRGEVKEAADYVTRYLEYHRIKHKKSEHSLTVQGKGGAREVRFAFSDTPENFKAGDTRLLRMICGDTRDAAALLKPQSVHLIVTDAPYGVQKGTAGRQDSIGGTLSAAMAGWHSILKPGGALALSFKTYVTKRARLEEMLVRAGFCMADAPSMEHWVEQAINRDVILAVKR